MSGLSVARQHQVDTVRPAGLTIRQMYGLLTLVQQMQTLHHLFKCFHMT